jgi:hypothetical protein
MILATDIQSVAQIGPQAWADSFRWPVSDTEFRELCDGLLHVLGAVHERSSGALSDALLADGFGWVTQLAHAAVVSRRCEQGGWKPLGGEFSGPFFAPDWRRLGQAHVATLRHSAWTFRVRRVARNLVQNTHVPAAVRLRSLHRPDALALGSVGALRSAYVRDEGLLVDHTYPGLLSRGWARRPRLEDPHESLRELCEAAASFMQTRFDTRMDLDGLHEALSARVATLAALHGRAQAVSRALPLLVTESARPVHKAVASGWRAGAGTSVGFHHGHSAGEIDMPGRPYTEFYSYDDFVCPSAVARDSFADLYTRSGLAKRQAVTFRELHRPAPPRGSAPRAARTPRPVRRVMVMGFPMNAIRYGHLNGTFWAPQLELEIRLARLLRQRGFEVLYKVHPEVPQPASTIMSSLGCEVLPQPLNQVIDRADAFIIKYSASTTFVPLLLTDAPIYFIDVERPLWKPDYHQLLCKRCVVLDAHEDDSGRVVFDEQMLLERLDEPGAGVDHSFTERFHS